ncbi:glutamyl-tRNA reductase [Chitinophagaceae bacterium LWZ2-11]
MAGTQDTESEYFFIVGLNYKKTDASIRGRFAISPDQYQTLLQSASSFDLSEFFVLSTCNRTEIYGIAKSAEELMQLLCTQTTGDIDTFKELAYIKSGKEAIDHLFSVAAGLDSQILGDYEIVGQMKQAVKLAKEKGFINTFMERLFNYVLQSSKAIKNQTELSGGTVSVSFAAIQFLRENVENIQNKKILLIGTGKIGRNTCKNIVDYLGTTNITLVNRTDIKAKELADLLELNYAPYSELPAQIQSSDIILVATNSELPVILKKDLESSSKKVLIDLSIPNNIEPSAGELSHITLVNVDELSKLKDETLQKREAEVPKAKYIIAEHMAEFDEWYDMRRNVPVLKAVKQKLLDMHHCELFTTAYATPEFACANNDAIQKVVKNMAVKLRQHNTKGCHYIEAINDYITVGSNS